VKQFFWKKNVACNIQDSSSHHCREATIKAIAMLVYVVGLEFSHLTNTCCPCREGGGAAINAKV
jgi:hypothetical protein